MKSVHFGFGADWGAGSTPSVGLNRRGNVLMVYEARRGEKRYCVGRLDEATIEWQVSKHSGLGITPRVALNNRDIAVEVHRNVAHNKLYCRVGGLGGAGAGEVRWLDAHGYAEGSNCTRPAVALNDKGVVVEMHELRERNRSSLEFAVGHVKGFGREQHVAWSRTRGRGAQATMPAIAINDGNTVVEVHKKANDWLFFSVGRVNGTTIDFKPEQQIVIPNGPRVNGRDPSVAITDDGLVIVVLRARTKVEVIELVGQLSVDRTTINWHRWSYYDDGTLPSVAAAGTMAVEFHQHENDSALRFSTSIITDRASWMQDRLATLGPKRLRDLVLPASHDAGMYVTSLRAPRNIDIARTQNLSIYEQLRYGIRYFDLRLEWLNRFVIHHGIAVGPDLQTVLNDVRRFAREGHQELVILGLFTFKSATADSYRTMITQVLDTIGRWVVRSRPKNTRLTDVTLNDYVKDGPAVLVVVDRNFPVDIPETGFWVYRDWNKADNGDFCVFDQYANVQTLKTMRDDQFEKFENFEGVMEHHDLPCDLFLLSWTLTPRSASPTPWQLARRANPWLGRDVRHRFPPPQIPNEHREIMNLIYVDYVESARVTDVALFHNGEDIQAAEATPQRRSKAAAARSRQRD